LKREVGDAAGGGERKLSVVSTVKQSNTTPEGAPTSLFRH